MSASNVPSTSGTYWLEQLPTETVLQIFSHLPLEAVKNLSETSKTLDEISKTLFVETIDRDLTKLHEEFKATATPSTDLITQLSFAELHQIAFTELNQISSLKTKKLMELSKFYHEKILYLVELDKSLVRFNKHFAESQEQTKIIEVRTKAELTLLEYIHATNAAAMRMSRSINR